MSGDVPPATVRLQGGEVVGVRQGLDLDRDVRVRRLEAWTMASRLLSGPPFEMKLM